MANSKDESGKVDPTFWEANGCASYVEQRCILRSADVQAVCDEVVKGNLGACECVATSETTRYPSGRDECTSRAAMIAIELGLPGEWGSRLGNETADARRKGQRWMKGKRDVGTGRLTRTQGESKEDEGTQVWWHDKGTWTYVLSEFNQERLVNSPKERRKKCALFVWCV
ncbi:uncharacterized protein MEPE_04255 [Melanopsichium pennsylvanicum]|uniref:Uncharacterized protein n=1 Tax=Melanopsichium pennsylvanicum TaxID=63383 RepID=A0AAJ5C687_9BASI|nr:uncharacterized protein MEPE_04255 [Melanopsichium pennsylvanicum]